MNDYMQITKDEAESLLNFIELDFFESVHHDGCDNIEYIANICSIWRKAKNLIAEASE